MNRILEDSVRNKLENALNYTGEENKVIKKAKIYDTFTTAKGLSYQINSVLKKHGIVHYAVVENNVVKIERIAINLK